MSILDPVSQLEMRAEFINNIIELSRLCNWTEGKVEDLQRLLLEELSYIDNLMYEVYEKTRDRNIAFLIWEGHMEDLRRWLSLILGVKIKYV